MQEPLPCLLLTLWLWAEPFGPKGAHSGFADRAGCREQPERHSHWGAGLPLEEREPYPAQAGTGSSSHQGVPGSDVGSMETLRMGTEHPELQATAHFLLRGEPVHVLPWQAELRPAVHFNWVPVFAVF